LCYAATVESARILELVAGAHIVVHILLPILLLLSMFGPTPIKVGAVFDGDSLTCTSYSSYPRQAAAIRRWQQYTNVAVCGQTIQQMLQAGSRLDPMRDSGQATTLIGWGGTNDIISGADATTVYNGIVAYASQRRSAGWRILVLDILPRVGFTTAMETQRVQVNALLRQNWRNFASGFVDVAGDARLSNPNNTTYFAADATHLTDAGYGVVAGLVCNALG
jgi:hypothetical protein